MTYTPHGCHIIAGARAGQPDSGSFANATVEDVDRAARAAEAAFAEYSASSRAARAGFLERIADEIEVRAADLTPVAMAETHLPQGRIEGERGRTTGQLRMFADHIRKGDYLDRRVDEALPDRTPPRPELQLCNRAIGPVAVFGASNFPLAFSTAGGDTASALAAGCPVIVKGHPSHPGTAEIVAEAIEAARAACGLPAGVFSLLQSQDRVAGQALVRHPLVAAVGFTGSLAGGRALFDLCASRPEPIPFFGELGSINPVFVLPEALAQRGAQMAADWAASLTMGAGQFCTNPGLLVLPESAAAEAFLDAASAALRKTPAQAMLNPGIAQSYAHGSKVLGQVPGVENCVDAALDDSGATPGLLRTSAEAFLTEPRLAEEVFGPLGLVVTVRDAEQCLELAGALHGQLTCTLQMDSGDTALARRLVPVLERKAGRLLVNGYPTGVEVCDAMVHGGPYPASTNFGATSVGTLAIRRFLRPVCYQNMPAELLPADLRIPG